MKRTAELSGADGQLVKRTNGLRLLACGAYRSVMPRRSDRGDAFAALRVTAIAMALAACGGEPASPIVPPPVVEGAVIEAGPPPTEVACSGMLKADLDAAVRIRTEIRVDGVVANQAAAAAAAADPAADLSSLGVPLSARELKAIRDAGWAIDGSTPLAYWTQIGEPERFGGIWIDPPGSSHYVVSILRADPATVRLAQCLDHVGARFVATNVSYATGSRLMERISAETEELKASGILVTMIDYDETKGTVTIGVQGVNEAIRAQLVARYGPLVRVVEQGVLVPM